MRYTRRAVSPLSLLFVFLVLAAGCSAGSSSSDPPGLASGDPAGSPATTFRPNDSSASFDLDGGATSGDDGVVTTSFDDLSDRVASLVRVWETDWTRSTIDLDQLIAGIPRPDPRDAIPPIDEPVFETSSAAAEWLDPDEPGAMVELGGEARFYPLSILTRHEIVNDRFGGVPVAVTYCPLCNTAVSFDRRIDGKVVRLGVSGLLRRSDMVMWDDETTSLWQQITGEAIVGRYAGTRLELIGTQIVSFSQFADGFVDGVSLSRDTGFNTGYGANPYVGYSSSTQPFLLDGEPDPRLPALERVVGIGAGGKAYPFSDLDEQVVINDDVDGQPIVVWWVPGTRDALDRRAIAESRAVGTAIAHGRVLADGTELSFAGGAEAGTFIDEQTGSSWNLFGRATAGELEGQQLPAVAHRNEFWVAWAAFFPDSPVYGL